MIIMTDRPVVPDLERKTLYKKFMAEMIYANNHDLVIESANRAEEAETHEILRSGHGWNGKYVTVNSFGQPYGISERLRTDLESSDNSSPVHTGGDGMDHNHINGIIEVVKPRRPVYVVNMAVGIMLSYERDLWVPRDATPEESVRKMAGVWGEGMRKMKLDHAYMTGRVYDDHDILGGTWKADQGGVSETVYELLCNELRKNGWAINRIRIGGRNEDPGKIDFNGTYRENSYEIIKTRLIVATK